MSDSEKITADPSCVPAATPVEVDKLEIHDDRHREAYRLRRAGRSMGDIASFLKVDVRTIYRWIREYEESYKRGLESRPCVNLIADEVAKLDEMEQTARQWAESSKYESHKRAFLNLALKAMQARQHLLLEVGVLPREPTKIYSAVQQLKPAECTAESADEVRSDDEVRIEVLRLLKHCRTL